MKSIILKPHELANIDRLAVVVRPFKKQPSNEWTPFGYGEVHKMVDGEFVQPLEIIGWGPCNESGSEAYISPFSPGETVFVKEAFAYCILRCDITDEYHSVSIPLSRYKRDCKALNSYHVAYKNDERQCDEPLEGEGWKSSRSMPQWASRYHITIKEVEGKKAKDFGIYDIEKIGLDVAGFVAGFEIESDGSADGNEYDDPDAFVKAAKDFFYETYKCTPDNWLWLWKVEVKKV